LALFGLDTDDLLGAVGAVVGFSNPITALGALGTAALGSGIGTLVGGGDFKDAVQNAAIAGALGYGGQQLGILGASQAAGAGAGAGAGAAGAEAARGAMVPFEAASGAARDAALGAGSGTVSGASGAAAQQIAAAAPKEGILSNLSLTDKLILGSMVLSAFEEPEQISTEFDPSMLESNPDYQGRAISGLFYDLQTGQYADQPRREQTRGGDVLLAAQGGYIQGPGTGRSDSIKSGIYQNGQKVQEARLSDGEFVMTERAVRGLGGGDRAKGAAKMYEMMRQYEEMA
jgi:hypothetical protein